MAKPRYRHAHQQLRKQWAVVVESGDAHCWRCGRWLPPGCLWDLGHDDRDPTAYRGAECRPCNRGTAAVRGNKMRAGRRRGMTEPDPRPTTDGRWRL